MKTGGIRQTARMFPDRKTRRNTLGNLKEEINRRRTFAIISHPDAGKTTLTEKFLLYGGAINLAGSVKGKATARHAVSDWMEIEKQRGISVTSSVLQFEYAGTPGLLRGHIPYPDGGGFCSHGHRREQGRRGADPKAVQGLCYAQDPDFYLYQ